MTLFNFLRTMLAFDFPKEQEIKVRIIIRDPETNVVKFEKLIPIISVFSAYKVDYGINIEQSTIDSTDWKSIC